MYHVSFILCLLALRPAPPALSQIPQGFNYQAVASDGITGNPITEMIDVRIAILSNDSPEEVIWQEIHEYVDPDDHGLFSIVVGQGTYESGPVTDFADIDWTVMPKYIRTQIFYDGSWKNMGSAQLWSVPYAMVADSLGGPLKKLAVEGETTDMEEALFEVRNKDGNTVFAVYNEGVRIYVGDGDVKGPKGGFAIGGFGSSKDENDKRYFFVDDDSVRIYLNGAGKSAKGGFAIGGYGTVKGDQKFLTVSYDSVRIYVDNDEEDKGVKGGFAIGGYGITKGKTQKLLTVSDDSVRIYINDKSKGPKGGFAIGGFDKTKGEGNNTNFFNVATSADDTINPSQNRILWYPVKNAFMTGKVLVELPDSVGENSFASGFESKALGDFSQALGYKAIARGDYSTAIGKNAVANEINSFAFGEDATAKNDESYAIGRGAIAEGFRSFAFGSAGLDSAGVVTDVARAKGEYSFAIGQGSQAAGKGAFAMGVKAEATGDYSVSIGNDPLASAFLTTAIGAGSEASINRALAVGAYTTASGEGSFAGGYNTWATKKYSLALGVSTGATGDYSAAIGYRAEATNLYSAALGGFAKAHGQYSLALGYGSWAKGTWSYAIGRGIRANENETVLGRFNKEDESDALFIVGTGTGEATRKNALVINTFGRTSFSDPITIGASTTSYTEIGAGSAFFVDAAPTVSLEESDNLKRFGINVNSKIFNIRELIGSTWYNRLSVIENGNIGIGTTAPAQRLEVAGNIMIGGNLYLKDANRTVGTSTAHSLYLASNNTVRMTINSSGNVGIGTTAPNEKLEINGNIQLSAGSNRYIIFPDRLRSLFIGGVVGYQSAYAIHFITDNGSNIGLERLSIVGDRVGINITSPSQALHVVGNARFTAIGSGSYYGAVNRTSDGTLTTSTSDIRLKTNICSITNGLSIVLKLRGVYFKWIDEPEMGNRIGMIAQEVEKVVPELVFTNNVDGYKGINYPEMSAVLVEAIKEQQAQIESQNQENLQLKSELQSIKDELAQIKVMMGME
ncbi:MAG: hypothetical protein A2Y71_00415 [Bacteroidetes bacterium RBG_13_42_15]|nr:MAG: hypothetical protein A2Y71_00415 [Bacteroidetes bacterium RBG_13_42_15]